MKIYISGKIGEMVNSDKTREKFETTVRGANDNTLTT